MKSKLIKVLTVVFALALSFSLFTACGEPPHEHDYSVLKADASNHWYECSCGEKNEPEAHKGGTATCTAKAKCEVCETAYGELAAHVYTSVVTAPTCTAKGYTTHTCTCGDSYVDTYVDEIAHTYTSVVTAPTCTEQGFTTHTCTCGDSYVDTYVDALDHAYGAWTANNDGTHTKVCANDATHVVTENCAGGTATCEGKAVCTSCSAEYGAVLGHAYPSNWSTNGDGTHSKVCANDATHVLTENCAGGTATCEDKAVCDACSAEYGVALGHAYGAWASNGDNTHSKVCANDATHVVTENCAGGTETCTEKAVCSSCNTAYGPEPAHDYEDDVTEPTCEEQGYTTHTCHCGDSYIDTYVDALNHAYGEWIEGEDGVFVRICANDASHVIYDDGLVVLYSANDKELDLLSLKRALDEQEVKINALTDIEGYVVNGETVSELVLEPVITRTASNSSVKRYQIDVVVAGTAYRLNNVYAYTQLIDEASDLALFVLNEETAENRLEGYYMLTKDIDATDYAHATHVFTGGGTTFAGSKDKGFSGTLDGNGHTISNFTAINNGLFGQATAPVVKNIAFTNVTITGYYGSLFAHSINRDGWDEEKGSYTIEALFENVYIQIDKVIWGASKRVGILANNTMPLSIKVRNVVVEYTNAKADGVYDNVYALTHEFGIFGGTNGADMQKTLTYEGVYAISDLPVMYTRGTRPYAAENQVEHSIANGYHIDTVGEIYDTEYANFLTAKGLTLNVHMVARGLRYYKDKTAMSSDNEATAESLAKYDSKYWLFINGVPYWKSAYASIVDATVSNSQGNAIEGEIVLNDNATEITLGLSDGLNNLANVTIEAPEAFVVDGNKVKLAATPVDVTEYEIKISAIVDGVVIERVITVIGSNAYAVKGKVLYSAFDKSLDLPSVNKALAEAGLEEITLEDIDAYVVDGEEVEELDLEVIITAKQINKYVSNVYERVVDQAQEVSLIVDDKEFVLYNVYAYTRLIDEVSDLDWFSKVNMTVADYEESGATDWAGQTIYTKSGVDYVYDMYDGYYLVTKNLNGAGLGAEGANYRLAGPADSATAGKKNVGLRGVFDGNGYTISNIHLTCDGFFGNVYAGIIRNVAFVNITAGGYYQSLFGRNISYSDLPHPTTGVATRCYPVLENIYIEGTKFTKNKDVGILAYQSCVADTRYVVINHTLSQDEKDAILAGKQHGISGLQLTYKTSKSFEDVYVIGDLPVAIQFSTSQATRNNFVFAGNVLKLKDGSETEYEVADKTTFAFLDQALNATYKGQYTWTPTVPAADTLWTIDYMPKVKQYINADAMKLDAEANAETLAKFSTDCWTIANGVPVWKTLNA